jgi:hypothetical protein
MAKIHRGIRFRRIIMAYLRRYLKYIFLWRKKTPFVDAIEFYNKTNRYKIKVYVNNKGELTFQSTNLQGTVCGIIEYPDRVKYKLNIPLNKTVLDFGIWPTTLTEQ